MHLKLLLLVHTLLRKYIHKVKSMPLFIQWEDEQVTGKVSNILQGSIQHCISFPNQGDSTPSPNSYTLPCLLGHRVPNKPASSSYSMASRPITGSFSEDLAKTPGPGCYNAIPPNIYTPRAPGYSMLGRSYMPGGNLNMSKTATNIHLLC